MKKFEVANIHCANCAKTIKNALEDEFGIIEIDLNTKPCIVSLNLNDEQVESFKNEMSDIGFDVIKELL